MNLYSDIVDFITKDTNITLGLDQNYNPYLIQMNHRKRRRINISTEKGTLEVVEIHNAVVVG